ncbi:uncharacterized protein B0T15DRAFT_497489 [Chaetomium strumarium]|uniref:DUF4604 domain-containing protein n=1 Tax=Chaetomium strumarium TaxID=1170767 RepID=A0AAJ0LXZ6_9PEZI|nr:hypothetical protein B0T15DRAFT_497489 [Chaetomium strumarium]
MSRKITANNLQYTTTLPPFLARLRGQHTSETDRDAPDPILAARRRPAKPRSGSAEAEDAPLVVDEYGNTVVDITVGVDGTVKEKSEQAGSAGDAQNKDGDTSSSVAAAEGAAGEQLPGVIQAGAQRKKRKIGRVIGGADADEGESEETGWKEKEGAKTSKPATATAREPQESGDSAPAPKAKTKKKAKKIKLSFGDEEG